MSAQPEFSIVTPSLNQLDYLKRCCRSVGDQEDVDFEHLVMDGGSSDDSAEWLREQPGITGVSEKDEGMYDAVNRGFRRARGEVLAYLNCDEQYLPGALRAVSDYLHRRPEVDFVYGDALLVRPDGSLIAFRKAYPLRWYYVRASHLYVLTCTLFVRRRVIEDGNFFDESFRDNGDAEFVLQLLRRGYRPGHLRRYLAAFTMTGRNMHLSENARRESALQLRDAPAWVRNGRLPLNLLRWGEKLLFGAYRQKVPFVYSVYGPEDEAERTLHRVEKASFRWRSA